ncbi:MAG: signal peptidase II [Lachnospiraceae bacterium]|nr:signal peptidase II [Lachnospiraceae bacterium]
MLYMLIAAGIFAGEYFLKNHIESTRKPGEESQALGGKIVIRRYHNRGAFLNLGEKKSALMRALSVGLTIAVLVLFICTLTRKGNGLLKAGLSLLLGGAFSNTYDRLKRKYVVDYFSFKTGLKSLDRVVFNLADFAIMIGALCTALGA